MNINRSAGNLLVASLLTAIISSTFAAPTLARGYEPCIISETEVANSNPPAQAKIDICGEIDITVNASGTGPIEKEPAPTVATTDGMDGTLGPVLFVDSAPEPIGSGQSWRILRLLPLRKGTAEVTFYKPDGSVRAIMKVTVGR